MRLRFNRSPAHVPVEYDTIIPGGGGYYVGLFRNADADGKLRPDWHARILDKGLIHRLAGFEFSCRTKRELVSWLDRHQDELRAATERLDR